MAALGLMAMTVGALTHAAPAVPEASRAVAAGVRARAASEAAYARLAASGGPLAALAADPTAFEQTAGFFEPALLPTLAALDSVMRDRGVHGAVCEIGVYHGRGFVPLALLRRAGERAVAVDVFEQQHLNQDASGAGDEQTFHATLSRFGVTADVVVLREDSTVLSGQALLATAGGGLRFLGVDGSHTEAAAFSDLQLAAATLVEGGVLLLDDALNPDWPGVASALARHLRGDGVLGSDVAMAGSVALGGDAARGGEVALGGEAARAPPMHTAGVGRLVPFALGYNKCLLTTSPEWARVYGQAVAPLARKRAVLMGHECLILPSGWIAAHFGNDASIMASRGAR
jgi:hypothetical protein